MKKEKLMLLGCGLLTAATMQAQEEQKPNIIYIKCNELSNGDLACNGQKCCSAYFNNSKTPHSVPTKQKGLTQKPTFRTSNPCQNILWQGLLSLQNDF